MQKIKTVRYSARNIGGDRCFSKLRYVIGTSFAPDVARKYNVQKLPFNVGAQYDTVGTYSIHSVFGDTPNLSTLAQFYNNYRIRGIKLRITAYYVGGSSDPPLCLFATAQTSSDGTDTSNPRPVFPTPSINVTPEQRWTTSRVISNAGNGGKPTTLSVYYSVNKVFGPDAVVKNDAEFTGELQTTTPFWSKQNTTIGDQSRPKRGPWLMYGIYSMDSEKNIPITVNITLKVEATVYAEMFGKRPSVQ